jgi:hypothetical protein
MYHTIKIYEPAKGSHPELGDSGSHPARVRFTDCLQDPSKEGDPEDSMRLRVIGGQGSFLFVDGVCEDFRGEYRAKYVGAVTEPRRDDRFAEATHTNYFIFNNGAIYCFAVEVEREGVIYVYGIPSNEWQCSGIDIDADGTYPGMSIGEVVEELGLGFSYKILTDRV